MEDMEWLTKEEKQEEEKQKVDDVTRPCQLNIKGLVHTFKLYVQLAQ